MSKEFKCVSGHAEDLEPDGRVVAPGERVPLTDEEVNLNARLFAEEKFIAVSDQGQRVIDSAVKKYEKELKGDTEELEEAQNAQGGET
jgi:hypothetical protein